LYGRLVYSTEVTTSTNLTCPV